MTLDVFGDRKLWAILLAGAFAAFLVLKLLGCTPAKDITALEADIAKCDEELTKRVIEAESCMELQLKVEAALATVPECKNFPRFQVCASIEDGGAHDGG